MARDGTGTFHEMRYRSSWFERHPPAGSSIARRVTAPHWHGATRSAAGRASQLLSSRGAEKGDGSSLRTIRHRPKTFDQWRIYTAAVTIIDTGCRINELLTVPEEVASPLRYGGLAEDEDKAPDSHVERVLAAQGVRRIVMGTP
jgi:hypothetical protein